MWSAESIPKPGSVSLVTRKTIATPVTLELGLVLVGYMMTPTPVETRLPTVFVINEISVSLQKKKMP